MTAPPSRAFGHTAGPWRVDPLTLLADEWPLIHDEGRTENVCRVFGMHEGCQVNHETRRRMNANARLIASAPELYAALEALETRVSTYLAGDCADIFKDTLEQSRAALRAAGGGA